MQERVPSNLTLTFEEISEARIYCLRQAQGSFSFDIHPLQRGKAVANTANTFIHGLRERPALCRWAPIKVATTGGSQASNSSAETSFPTYFRTRTQDTSSTGSSVRTNMVLCLAGRLPLSWLGSIFFAYTRLSVIIKLM